MNLFHGDSVQVLRRFPNDCFDAVVTDPPYGLSFMGKKWDYDVPSVELWREVLRVLKPGGHVLSFGGTRTYHRMVVNIEDAGFEIRDQVQWLYGSGFPKSHNIGKTIDKIQGNERIVVGEKDVGPDFTGDNFSRDNGKRMISKITKGNSDWEGFGTALKPANEPICLARKPLEKGLTVAENVLKWGTGAINVDGCRIGTELVEKGRVGRGECESESLGKKLMGTAQQEFSQGRWPANLLLDEAAAEMLDAQTGELGKSAGGNSKNVGNKIYGKYEDTLDSKPCGFGDTGGASRFFYVAKASKRERNAGLEGMPTKHVGTYAQDEWSRNNMGNTPDAKRDPVQNFHPTVKPIKLMEYLITLIAPPNGTVLDPFMGSGSTGVAAKNLGFNFTGIELSEEYFEIAKRRLDNKKQLELHETP